MTRVFEKQTKRLTLKTPFKIEFLLPFPRSRKVLEKMPDSNKLLVHKLQSIHPNQNQKQITRDSNKLCMLQTGRKKH